VDVHPIDPRDEDTGVDDPVYRVFFWERLDDRSDSGFRSDEYEITEAADVRKVMEWAEANVGPNRTFTLYAFVDRCQIRLMGRDPTGND
jgi:hypothetical protein